MEYFQDDIFSPTRDRSKSTMTAEQWFAGRNIEADKVSIRPADMKPCKFNQLQEAQYFSNILQPQRIRKNRNHQKIL